MKYLKSISTALAFVSAIGIALVSGATDNSGPVIAQYHVSYGDGCSFPAMTFQSNCDVIMQPFRCSVGDPNNGGVPAFKNGTNCQTILWTSTP